MGRGIPWTADMDGALRHAAMMGRRAIEIGTNLGVSEMAVLKRAGALGVSFRKPTGARGAMAAGGRRGTPLERYTGDVTTKAGILTMMQKALRGEVVVTPVQVQVAKLLLAEAARGGAPVGRAKDDRRKRVEQLLESDTNLAMVEDLLEGAGGEDGNGDG